MVEKVNPGDSTTIHALGSAVRDQLTDASGVVTYARAYDPYGVVSSTVGSSQTSYGYTGESYDTYIKLIYLRSRWYDPASGRFQTKDSWQGDYNRPLSLNRWNYVESNPVNYTDPSGHFPTYCQSMPTKGLYELCVLGYYGLEPISYFELGERVQGAQGCYSGPSEYRAPGYLGGVGIWTLLWRFGGETVYDFATLERGSFTYFGAGVNEAADIGAGAQVYLGMPFGFRTDGDVILDYRGVSSAVQGGISADLLIGAGAGVGGFVSWSDPMLRGSYLYVGASISLDVVEGGDVDIMPTLFYAGNPQSKDTYLLGNGRPDKSRLFFDILTGRNTIIVYNPTVTSFRAAAAVTALHYANVYEELKYETTVP
jgi:RHS repeat-associated protein